MLIPPQLLNEIYDDRYFDVIDAVTEAKLIFFQGCELLKFLDKNKNLRIGETGFGAGRILISLMDYLCNTELTGLQIEYNSVELHPINSEKMRSILNCLNPNLQLFIDTLFTEYRKLNLTQAGWHKLKFNLSFGSISLNIWIGEALGMINNLTVPCHMWFLDGHSPKKNPAMWRPELLEAIGEKTLLNGTCATYTVAGSVRRGLTNAGFCVERCSGFGVKKNSLKGIKVISK